MLSEKKIKFNFSTGLCIELVLVFFVALFTVLRKPSLVSYSFIVTFFVFAVMAAQYLTFDRFPLTLLFLITISFANVAIDAVVSKESHIGFDFFRKYIMFSFTMICFFAMAEMPLDRLAIRFLMLVPAAIGILLPVSYYFFGNRGTLAHGITLSFSNPNYTGMWLCHVFYYLLYDIAAEKKWSLRIGWMVPALLCLVLILKTLARSSIVSLAFFALLLSYGVVTKRYELNKLERLIVVFLPMLLFGIYMLVFKQQWFIKMFQFIVQEGKKLDARERIWKYAWNAFVSSPVLGNYSRISGGSGASQMHNTHIDVLASYGAVPFILFVQSLYFVLSKVSKTVKSYPQYVALCSFAAIIALGSFEAGIVSGSTGLYILSGGFLALTRVFPEVEKE